jgi:4-hydroxy-tetrahydrodipicolinate synthase
MPKILGSVVNKKELAGVFPYLVSPVGTDGKVKEEVLRSLVKYLIGCGVHGLTPLGSTGEFAYLTWDQRRRITEIVIDAASGRVPVVTGIAHTSIREAVRQAKEVESMGVDAILAIMESYFPVPPQGVISYFRSIAEAVSCPIVLYSNPNFSTNNFSIEILEELIRVPNILYLKDASSNTGNLLTIIEHLKEKIKIFSASAHIPLFVMMLGGVGWMSGPSCVIPRQSVKLYELACAKRWDEATLLQKKLWGINRIFQKYSLAPCIKACLELQGFAVGDPVPPLQPLSGGALHEVQGVLKGLEVLAGQS